MSLIVWSEQLSVGIPSIDADHQLLIDLLHQLAKAREDGEGRDVVGSILTVLSEYTRTHFRREEHLMSEAGYSGLEEHRKSHQALAAQVADINARCLAGETAAVDAHLMDVLSDWLNTHILGEDMAYRSALASLDVDALEPTLGLDEFDWDEDEQPE